MRGRINVVAAASGLFPATAGDGGDIGQSASVKPIPVPLGSTTINVPGGASPTNAVITLINPVPGVGASASVYDDEFSTAPWQAHRTWQTGDKWAFAVPNATDGAPDLPTNADTWWANPIATPAAVTVYPPPAKGILSLGLMNTPAGTTRPDGSAMTETFIGTIINNLLAGGSVGRLFGYHEFRVKMPNTQGVLFQWDIEDYLTSGSPTSWNLEIDFRMWIDTSGAKHINVQLSGQTTPVPAIVIYQTTAIDTTQFHVYGINWQTDHITVYVDGLQVAQVSNPGGVWQTNACFPYMLTSGGAEFGQNNPIAASLPAFVQIDYYRLFANLPSTAGTVLVHAFNPGGTANTITDVVGQSWIRHPDSRIGSPPFLTAICNNTKPMAVGQTITIGFTNPSTNTAASAVAWYVPFVNGSSFGSLANVGSSGGTTLAPNAPTITAGTATDTGVPIFVTLPSTGPALNAGVVQLQYRLSGTTPWTIASVTVPYITPSNGSILDGVGNTWTLAANGNPVINSSVTDTASHAQELFLVAGSLWQFDGNLWYSTQPTGTITAPPTWTQQTSTSPLLTQGIALGGLSAGHTYDVTAYVSNLAGTGALASVIQITTTNVSGAGTTLSDDFDSLILYNWRAPAPGEIWEPVVSDSPNNDGTIGGANHELNFFIVNPFNPATPITNLYTDANSQLIMGLDNTPAQFASVCGNQPFVASNLQTQITFTQTFGYFEIRCAVQKLQGSEFGFVLYHAGGGQQIDIIEIFTDASNTQAGSFALWDQTSTTVLQSFYTYNAVGVGTIDCSQMHTYGVDLQANTTTFYIDRVAQVSHATPAGYNVPFYMSFGMASSNGGFLGTLTNTAALPIFAFIDYIKVWTTPPFGQTTVTAIALSNNTVTSGVAPPVKVGTFNVTMSSGSFTGGMSAPAGTDGAKFSVTGLDLFTAANLAAGNYNINETATQGVSSLTKPFTISAAAAGGGTGPAAFSAFMTADFTSAMNIPTTSKQQVVTQKINGCFIGWGGDRGDDPNLGPRGPDPRAFSAYSSNTWTSQAALVNFGVLQVTGNLWPNGWFNGDDTVNHNGLDNLINNFYKIDPLGIAGIMWGMNFGYPNSNDNTNGGDSTRYAKAYKNLAQYIEGPAGIMPNGKRLPLIGFGSSNEPSQNSEGTIAQFFNAFVPAVKSVNPNYLIKGPQFSSLYRGNVQTFLSDCNPKPDGVDWDAFSSGDTGPQGNKVYLDSNFTNSVGDSIASGVLPSGYTPKFSCGMGNTTFNCSGTTDVDGVNGAMFWAMNWFNGLAGSRGWDIWMGAWDDGGQGSCGIITDQNNFALSAAGYLFGMQVRNLFGPRWQVPTNSQGLPTIATTPGTGRFGLLIINPGLGAKSGTVALSHWPVNSSGTGTINMWKMTNSVTTFGQDGTHSTVQVTGGVTTSISFPDPSVTLLYV